MPNGHKMVTVDQRSVRANGGIGSMELAKMVYEAENRKGRKPQAISVLTDNPLRKLAPLLKCNRL